MHRTATDPPRSLRHPRRTGAAVALSLAALLLLGACNDPTAPDATSNASASGGAGTGGSANLVTITLRAPESGAAFRSASGKAKLDTRNGRREFEAEVEHIPANVAVVFYLDGARIGTRTTDQFGHAELELSSERGQWVPPSVAGSTVSVRTAAGATIVAGTF